MVHREIDVGSESLSCCVVAVGDGRGMEVRERHKGKTNNND